MRAVIARACFGIWFGSVTAAAAQLPPEIQVDRHLVRAQRLISEDRPWAALAEMDKIVALQKEHDLTLPQEFHFKYARVAFAADRTETAIDSLNKYLVVAGREGEFYQEALELLDSAEERFRRDEVRRKRIEAEQRRVEAIQREHQELAQRQIEAAARPLPRDQLVSGGLGPEMVRIAGGRFQYYPSWSHRLQWVEFDQPFAISKYEVTRGEFEQFVKSTRYRTEARRDPKHGCGKSFPTWDENHSRNSLRWNRPGFDQEDTHPVVCVSTRDAMAYAEWLSRQTGRNYRLPSAAEWQYAARAGSSTAMLFVKPDFRRDDPDACRRGNVLDSSTGDEYAFKCSDGVPRTARVGQFPPNAVGLYDLVGNVEELVMTCYSNDTGLSSNPLPEHPDRCNEWVATRGSSWHSSPTDGLDYDRVGALPAKPYRGPSYNANVTDRSLYHKNSRNRVGFRVVRDLQNDDSAP